jgi:feruloyl esterase
VVNTATTNSGIAPVMTCSQVASLHLAAAVPDVPFEITSAAEVAAADNTLGKWAYCNVQGVIAPQIHFQLRLPKTGWQADYLQLGCGGLCGNVNTGNAAAYGCVPLTDGAFAVGSSDEGHSQGGGLFSTDSTCAPTSATSPTTCRPRSPRSSSSRTTAGPPPTPTSTAAPRAATMP